MDAIGLVRQDHRRLEALLDRYERTDQDDAEERSVLLARATEQHRRITTVADSFRPELRALADQIRTHLNTEDAAPLTALEAVLDDPALLDRDRRGDRARSHRPPPPSQRTVRRHEEGIPP